MNENEPEICKPTFETIRALEWVILFQKPIRSSLLKWGYPLFMFCIPAISIGSVLDLIKIQCRSDSAITPIIKAINIHGDKSPEIQAKKKPT